MKAHEPIPKVYKAMELSKTLVYERTLMAFQTVLGIPKGALSTEFRERLKNVTDKYPNFRCSAVREMIPDLSTEIIPTWQKRIREACLLMDVLETMVAEEPPAKPEPTPIKIPKHLPRNRNKKGRYGVAS